VRPRLIERFVLFALLGLILTSAVAAGVVVSLSRRDRRLRYRDELADALGSPVIASIRSRTPRDVAGWMTLLEDYTPGTLDAWALRQALRHLVSDEADNSTRSDDGMLHHHPVSVTVLCLGDDPRGLATAPQIASYAASVGITTRLVAAHGHESAAALWAACAGVGSDVEVRSDLYVSTDAPEDDEEVDLTVVLAVVDRHDPQLGDLPATSETIIAVAPGVATAEDLARTAVVADDADRRIAGIVVADPDDLDRTTGRLLQHERAQQVPLPAHMTGRTAPKSGRSNVSGIRRRSG
jgi:hypothetical protein